MTNYVVENAPRVLKNKSMTTLDSKTATPLSVTHPDLVETQWHPTLNTEVSPDDVSHGSDLKVWWTCARGHEWQARVADRARGAVCPICARNPLSMESPETARLWDYSKNEGISPDDVPKSSNKRVWWRCDKGHAWKRSIGNQSQKKGCPTCTLVREGKSLSKTNPDVAALWHPTKNEDLTTDMVTPGSAREVWWLCPEGHEYTRVVNRLNPTCPYCTGVRVLEGVNDLASMRPDLAAQWNDLKNDLPPSKYSCQSDRHVWWLCASCGHEWKSSPHIRYQTAGKCVSCGAGGVQDMPVAISSITDLPAEKSLSATRPDVAALWHPTRNDEVSPIHISQTDRRYAWWKGECGHEWKSKVITQCTRDEPCPYCSDREILAGFNDIPSLYPNLASLFAADKNTDVDICELSPTDLRSVWWRCQYGHEWKRSVKDQNRSTNPCPVCSGHQVLSGFNDLATTHPELADQWNHNRNVDLHPTDVSYGYSKTVWWVCEKGHEWEAVVSNRSRGAGCPLCPRTPIPLHLRMQWHPDKNGDVLPEDISAGSSFKAWWICEKGHEWRTSVANRYKGSGCHECAGRFSESLEEMYPELATQWHPTRNGTLTPNDVTPGSTRKVWWIGSCGHEWDTAVVNRVYGYGCSICASKRVDQGVNDLATLYPEIAAEWDYQRNGDLKPQDVLSQSNRKVWWICSEGHTWRTRVQSRVIGQAGCHTCWLKTAFKGLTFADNSPELVHLWHPLKNGDLTPHDVSSGSTVVAWWRCTCGYEWQAPVHQVSGYQSRCRACSGTVHWGTSLVERNPEVAAQWHPYKNGNLTPNDVTFGTPRKVWWRGECGHEWIAAISNRSKGAGCPKCAPKYSAGEKQLCEFVRENTQHTVHENFRGGFLGLQELDIYVPESHLGIEFNGVYWHDEDLHPGLEDKHNRKAAACASAGTRLVVVWEDDWKDHREVVEETLIKVMDGAPIPEWMTYDSRREGGVRLSE